MSSPQLRLEASDAPSLLRFVDTPEGPRAVYGEEDPPPSACTERFLLQAEEHAKRRRLDNEPQTEEERARALREYQRIALESLQRANSVAELLQRSTWGEEQTRFLHLHPAVEVSTEEPLAPALGPWPAALRECGNALETTELEAVLNHLRRRWLVHYVGGRHVVELWNESGMTEVKDSLVGKYVVMVSLHPHLGACLNFPHEIGRLVEWRHHLSVRVRPLRAVRAGRAETAAAPALPFEGLPRGKAMDVVLSEAQEVIVDQCAFRRLCEGLARRDGDRWRRWHVLRASSSEMALAVPVGTSAELIHVVVSYGGLAAEGSCADVWAWFAQAALLRLREMYLMGGTGYRPGEVARGSGELFGEFAAWLEPQLEAVWKWTLQNKDRSST